MFREPPFVITFASPKGGCGKSTCCLAVAGALAARGHNVHIIDFDGTRTLHRWFTSNNPPIANLTVEAASERGFLECVKTNYHQRTGFILIDIAGHFDTLMVRAAAAAHLTISPTKLNEPDLVEARKLHRQIANMATAAGKPVVEHRILINEVLPLLSTHQRQTLDQLVASASLKRFDTLVYSRAAYSEAYLSGLPAHFSDQARPSIRKATEEIDALVDEILAILDFDKTESEAA